MTGEWPWPGESATERARRIANSLLTLLPADEQPVWTARAHALGETWLGSVLITYDETSIITTEQAAALVHVSRDTIRRWACSVHPEDPARPLLPRLRREGHWMTYRATDVIDASAALRRARMGRLTRSP